MLVLTRKQNEKIKIGENITITVLRMKGKGVRLGIQAPDDMNVLRGELVFDLENDALPLDSDSTLDSVSEQALDSRAAKTSRPMRNSSTWSNDTHPNLKRDQPQSPVPNCQPSWSI